jgi:preprotein translocase subunit YajC
MPAVAAPNPILNFAPIVVVCLILYALVIRPQQKQAKEHRKMLENLKPGDRVLTQGGIYGVVASLKGTTVIVKIAENVKVEMSRSSIAQVLLETTNGTPVTKEVIS